jgi:hypothetical protein
MTAFTVTTRPAYFSSSLEQTKIYRDVTSTVPAVTVSGYLPLTTVFTPPAECFTDIAWYSPYGYGETSSYNVGIGPLSGPGCSPCWMGLPSSSSCFPPGWDVSAIYSPGKCPMGYTVACSSVNSIGTLTETVATCCPR